jgi:hypothetical protein
VLRIERTHTSRGAGDIAGDDGATPSRSTTLIRVAPDASKYAVAFRFGDLASMAATDTVWPPRDDQRRSAVLILFDIIRCY